MLKFLLLFILVTMLIIPASAVQYFPLFPTQTSNPRICVLDNANGEKYLKMTKDVVSEWSTLLNHYSRSNNWDMSVHLVDRMGAYNCNITFVYDLEQHDYNYAGFKINGKAVYGAQLGVTQCNEYGPSYCTINIHLLHEFDVNMTQTVEHEFGHALGLGHRQGNTQQDAMAAFLSDDIMFAKAKKFAHLTPDDIMALLHLYGSGGFHVVTNPPDVYLVTHPTHIKVACHQTNGTYQVCTQVR